MPTTARVLLLAVVAGLGLAGPARAATATLVEVDVPEYCEGEDCSPPYTRAALTVAADPGEAADVAVASQGTTFLVTAAGALTAGPGCVATGPGAATCVAAVTHAGDAAVTLVGGDGPDRLRASDVPGSLELDGGAGDDELSSSSDTGGLVQLDGGPGADTLTGGDGRDDLYGGPGADALHGGGGDDRLDGDASAGVATAPASTEPDLLDGGPGRDEASWVSVDVPITVDLADPGPDGAAGEGDRLEAIEDVTGGTARDTLRGDDGPNRLAGGLAGGAPPTDVVDGRGGDDDLSGGEVTGGAGDDTVDASERADCGAGRDVRIDQPGLRSPGTGCEAVGLLALDVAVDGLAHRTRAGLRERVTALSPGSDGPPVRLRLRASTGGPILAAGRAGLARTRSVTLRLTAAGRRAVARGLRAGRLTVGGQETVRVRIR